MRFQRISIPTPRMVTGNSEGEGGLNSANFLKESMNQLEFQGGGGSKPKNHPWGRYGYILEPHIIIQLPFTIEDTLACAAKKT